MDRPEERVALIELLARDGHVQRGVDVPRWPLTIGRALDNALVLEDPHVAAHHARLELDAEGRLVLQVGDTRNGVRLGTRWIAAGHSEVLGADDTALQVGATRLRLRRPGAALAPELALKRRPLQSRAAAIILLLATLLFFAVDHWIEIDPGADFMAWLPLLLGLPAGIIGWCALWALASKVFQQRFDFWGHFSILMPFLLGLMGVEALLPQVAASLGWPWLSKATMGLQSVLSLALLWSHAREVVTGHPRVLAGAIAGLGAVLATVSVVTSLRNTDRWGGELYMSTLPLPALRWGASLSAQEFVDSAAPLRPKLQARIKRARDEEAEAEAEDAGQ